MDRVVDTQLELYNTSWLHSLETFVGTGNLVFKALCVGMAVRFARSRVKGNVVRQEN